MNIHRLCIRSDVQLFGREVGAWLEYSCHSTQPYLCQAGDDDDGDDDDDGEDDDKEEEDNKSGHHPHAYLIIVIFFTLTQFLENKIYT